MAPSHSPWRASSCPKRVSMRASSPSTRTCRSSSSVRVVACCALICRMEKATRRSVWCAKANAPAPIETAVRPALDAAHTITLADGRTLEIASVFNLFSALIEPYTPEHAASVTTVEAETIVDLARRYASARTRRDSHRLRRRPLVQRRSHCPGHRISRDPVRLHRRIRGRREPGRRRAIRTGAWQPLLRSGTQTARVPEHDGSRCGGARGHALSGPHGMHFARQSLQPGEAESESRCLPSTSRSSSSSSSSTTS